jgi:hypothetical protein
MLLCLVDGIAVAAAACTLQLCLRPGRVDAASRDGCLAAVPAAPLRRWELSMAPVMVCRMIGGGEEGWAGGTRSPSCGSVTPGGSSVARAGGSRRLELGARRRRAQAQLARSPGSPPAAARRRQAGSAGGRVQRQRRWFHRRRRRRRQQHGADHDPARRGRPAAGRVLLRRRPRGAGGECRWRLVRHQQSIQYRSNACRSIAAPAPRLRSRPPAAGSAAPRARRAAPTAGGSVGCRPRPHSPAYRRAGFPTRRHFAAAPASRRHAAGAAPAGAGPLRPGRRAGAWNPHNTHHVHYACIVDTTHAFPPAPLRPGPRCFTRIRRSTAAGRGSQGPAAPPPPAAGPAGARVVMPHGPRVAPGTRLAPGEARPSAAPTAAGCPRRGCSCSCCRRRWQHRTAPPGAAAGRGSAGELLGRHHAESGNRLGHGRDLGAGPTGSAPRGGAELLPGRRSQGTRPTPRARSGAARGGPSGRALMGHPPLRASPPA